MYSLFFVICKECGRNIENHPSKIQRIFATPPVEGNAYVFNSNMFMDIALILF
jgi:hypothetical protein